MGGPHPHIDCFLDGCIVGKLFFQKCENCGHAQMPSRIVCAACRSPKIALEESVGEGVVASVTIVHCAPNEFYRSKAPYVVALIDLVEGFRAMMNIVGGEPDKVHIGQRVRIIFKKTGPGSTILPQADPIP